MKPIAVYIISNNMSVQIYLIDYDNDKVLAGINHDESEWCDIYYSINHNDEHGEEVPHFLFGELSIPFNLCIRV